MKPSLLPCCFLALEACVTGGPPRLAAPSHPDSPESPPLPASTAFASDGAFADRAEVPTPGPHAEGSAAPATGGPAGQAGATVYTCPMHPEIEQAEPGRCPACGMALVPEKRSGSGPGKEATGSEPHGEHHGRPEGARP